MAQILDTGWQRSGKFSKASVEGSTLALQTWEVNVVGADLDTVNFESAGLDEGIIGILGADWNLGGDWDASTAFFEDPPGLYPRDDLPSLQLYLNFEDNLYWGFPFARVLSASSGTEVKGKVSFKSGGKSQGQFNVPGAQPAEDVPSPISLPILVETEF